MFERLEQFVYKITHPNGIEDQWVTDLKNIWQFGRWCAAGARHWLRCKFYFPSPRLGPLTKYFIFNTQKTLCGVGFYLGMGVLRSTPYDISFGLRNLPTEGEVPENLIANILRNVYDLKAGEDYSFRFISEFPEYHIYSLAFKPAVFLAKVEAVYDFREVKWWERMRDYWEMKGNALFNIVSIATIVGGSVLLFLLWFIYLVSPKG